MQDPSHPTDVWVVSEDNDGDTGTGCASATSCWNTYIARYTFALPTVSALTPASGPAGGGESVLVSGSDFANPTTATLGGTPLTLSNVTPDSFTFTTPPGPAAGGLENVIATNSLGSSTATTGSAYLYIPLSNYVPVTPFRILDTRGTGGPFGPGVTRPLQVTVGTVPSNATAVVLNVTEVNGSASSLLTVYPFNTVRPTASNLNFGPGTVIANLITVTLGASSGEGWIDIYNALGSVNVLVDVEGYFTTHPATTFDGLFHPIVPVRVCDTRKSCEGHTAIGSGQSIVVTVPTTGGVPADGTAGSAVVNLTGVAGNASTYLSLFPTNSSGHCQTHWDLDDKPPAGGRRGEPGDGGARAHRRWPSGRCALRVQRCRHDQCACRRQRLVREHDGNRNPAGVSVPGASNRPASAIRASRRHPARPVRIGAGTALERLIIVAGHGGVPAFGTGPPVVAVIANLTAITPTAATYLTLFRRTWRAPEVSRTSTSCAARCCPTSSWWKLDTVSGNSKDGDVNLYNAAGSVNAIVDHRGLVPVAARP